MWRTLGNKPLTPLLRERSAFWVIGTHVVTSLFATVVVLFVGSCITSAILQGVSGVGDIAGFALLFTWFAIAGLVAASHSGHYLRAKAEFVQPTALVRQCTIWFGVVVLTVLIAVAVNHPSWLVRLMIPLTGCPCIAAFWWQTRLQFRKWEQEQAPLKSYGFPITPLGQMPTVVPAALPIAAKVAPGQWIDQVEVDGRTWQWVEQVEVNGRSWHLQITQDPETGEFTAQCRELPAAIEQGATAAEAITNGRQAIASVLDYLSTSGRNTVDS